MKNDIKFVMCKIEEKKSSFKAHKVKMAEYDDLDNDSRGTMDDEMVLMSRKFK